MDGKKYFRDCCKELNLDCDALFSLSAQNTVNGGSVVCNSPYHKRKKTQLFAVNFFQKMNVYIAWNLRAKKAEMRTYFSIKLEEVEKAARRGVAAAEKSIEYSGWGEETVFIFPPDSVPQFLREYCTK